MVLGFGVSVGLASLSWYAFELPISKLKGRLRYRTTAVAKLHSKLFGYRGRDGMIQVEEKID